jgi:tRNA threonylcarbamoyladenosine biosynthesis protein TsaB
MKNKRQIVLAIETALFPGSVSLLEDTEEIDFRVGAAEISRSEDLLPIVSDLLKKNQIHQKEIDLIGVSVGPGSFTGVRVGLATAKGLALGIGCACGGVSTLEALAVSAEKQGKIRSVIGGGRAEVFYQDFYFEETNQRRILSAIELAEIESLTASDSLSGVDAIVLDEKAKQKHPVFAEAFELKFQPFNPARYVGIIALENFKNGVLGGLLPQYAQAMEIGKSIEGL